MNQNLRANKTNFPYERLGTRTRFETEAKGNSEIAYWRKIPQIAPTQKRSTNRTLSEQVSIYLLADVEVKTVCFLVHFLDWKIVLQGASLTETSDYFSCICSAK